MEDLTALSIDSFLDKTATRSPTPGGGSVTALAGALSCALARMVVGYSAKKAAKEDSQPGDTKGNIDRFASDLGRADQILRALVTQDAEAYSTMTTAAKAAKDDASARPKYEQVVLEAVAVPMQMATLASNALATMDELKPVANKYLLSDLGIAAVLAAATAHAARYTVQVNAAELADAKMRDRVLAEIDEIVAHCDTHRISIEAFLRPA